MNRFVHSRAQHGQSGRVPTPPLAQSVDVENARTDRSSAQILKFTKKAGNTALTKTEELGPGYASNHFNDAEVFSHDQYQQADYGHGMDEDKEAQYQRDTLEETTVGSDFDRTKSDIGFEPELYGEYNDRGFSAAHGNGYMQDRHSHVERPGAKEVHILQYKQSQSPLRTTKSASQTQRQQPLAIAGRFEANKQHQDLQLRNGYGDAAPNRDQGSRKRSRSGGAARSQTTQGQRQVIANTNDDEDDLESLGGQVDATVRLGDVQFNSNSNEHAAPITSPIRQRKSRTLPQVSSSQNLQDAELPEEQENSGIDDRLIPDYSDAELKLMKYSDLDGEDWDMVPKPKPYKLPHELQGRKVTLEMKIEHHIKLDPEHEQLPFYESLSTEDWEKAGEVFMDKFSELMRKLKEKKRIKRETASQFENEIKEREKAVREHATKLDNELEGMEVAGQSLLGAKKKKSRG